MIHVSVMSEKSDKDINRPVGPSMMGLASPLQIHHHPLPSLTQPSRNVVPKEVLVPLACLLHYFVCGEDLTDSIIGTFYILLPLLQQRFSATVLHGLCVVW